MRGVAAIGLLVASAVVPACSDEGSSPPAARDTSVAADFADPPAEYLPSNRYWVPSGTGRPDDIRRDVEDMAAHGLGRLTYNDLVLTQSYDPAKAFGTAAWRDNLKTALDAGIDHDVRVDVLLTPGWSASSSLVTPDGDGSAKTLSLGRSAVLPAGQTFAGQIPLSALPDGVTRRDLQAVLAVRCAEGCDRPAPVPLVRASVVDLTDQVTGTSRDRTAEGLALRWTAPAEPAGGEWLVLSYFSQGSGLRPIGVPARDVYVVDHFAEAGTQAVIDRWNEAVLDDELRDLLAANAGSFWLDSLELGAADWTPGLLDAFLSERGYSLVEGLPTITAREPAAFDYDDGSGERFRSDWLRTMSERFVDRHLRPLQDWAHEQGMTLRYQSYSSLGPAPMIANDAWHAVDVPEAETGDARAVAAAAALQGHDVVATECCAFLGEIGNNAWRQRWPETLFRLNQSLSTGTTLIEYHGYPQRNGGDGLTEPPPWPGWTPFAPATGIAETWDARQPSWDDQTDINTYLGRNQYVLRQGGLRSDFAVVTRESGGMGDGSLTSPAVSGAGYSWGYLSDHLLAQVDAADGVLAPDGPRYRALVVDEQPAMSVATAERILELAEEGLPVVVIGAPPHRTLNTPGAADETAALDQAMGRLGALANVRTVASEDELPSALAELGVAPAAQVRERSSLQVIHRATETTDFYYLFNASQAGLRTGVGLVGGGRPYEMDAWTGRIAPATTYAVDGSRTWVDLDLGPGETTIVALSSDAAAFGFETEDLPDPFVESTGELVWRDGKTFARRTTPGTVTAETHAGERLTAAIATVPAPIVLRDWTVEVESWGKPDRGTGMHKTALPAVSLETGADGRLPSWLDIPALAAVSGVGTYRTTVELGGRWAGGHGAYLDLGPNFHTYRISVNGHAVANPNQIDASRIDLGPYLRTGENEIEVRVTTTMRNAILRQAPSEAGGSSTRPQAYGLTVPIRLVPYGEAPFPG